MLWKLEVTKQVEISVLTKLTLVGEAFKNKRQVSSTRYLSATEEGKGDSLSPYRDDPGSFEVLFLEIVTG